MYENTNEEMTQAALMKVKNGNEYIKTSNWEILKFSMTMKGQPYLIVHLAH